MNVSDIDMVEMKTISPLGLGSNQKDPNISEDVSFVERRLSTEDIGVKFDSPPS